MSHTCRFFFYCFIGFWGVKPVFQSKQDATFSLNWSYREEELTVANFFFWLLRFNLYIHFEKKVLTFTKKPVFYFSKDVASRVWFKMAHAQFCWQRKHFKNQVWSIYFRYFIMFATWKRVMSFISEYDMQKFV